jgi:hypothetical protein
MSFQRRLVAQLAPRFAAPLRTPAARSPNLRQVVQRRFVETSRPAEEIATENAFVKERRAVKEHAAATTGMQGAQRLRTNWRMLTNLNTADLWRKISL